MNRLNWFYALAILAAAAWGLTLPGCAAHAPAPQVEEVGQLAAGPSVYSAPLAHDEPPALGVVADTGDEVHALRAAPERADGVPETAAKTDGLTMGAAQ